MYLWHVFSVGVGLWLTTDEVPAASRSDVIPGVKGHNLAKLGMTLQWNGMT